MPGAVRYTADMSSHAADRARVRDMGPCAVVKCDNLHTARGRTCGMHAAMLSKYGVTLDWYNLALAADACTLCGKPFTGRRAPAIDHDHACCPGKSSCGKCIRGLLHVKCNVMLGYADDSASLLRLGAEYLERFATMSA